jgi:hypothetical protein
MEKNRARYEAWVTTKYGGKAACPQCDSRYIATTVTTEIAGSEFVRYGNCCFACQHRWEVEAPSVANFRAPE